MESIRKQRKLALGTALLALMFGTSASGLPPWETDPRWQQAEALQSNGDYAAAIEVLRDLQGAYPEAQRVALRMALYQEAAGLGEQAMATYDAADRIAPFNYWAEVGLYNKAQLALARGEVPIARACIARLRERFPESRWRLRAEVIAAEMAGADAASAQNAVDREEAAYAELRPLFDLDRAIDDSALLSRLNQIIRDHPGTGSALQAMDMKGHVLLRNQRHDEAIAVFADILDEVGPVAPQSRIAQTACTRIAALYHLKGKRREALDLFQRLANTAADPAVASNAAVQAAGLYFEILQHESGPIPEIPAAEWEKVRAMCRRVKDLPLATPCERARAELMFMETLSYEGRHAESLVLATSFITEHPGDAFRRERGTAHLFAGLSLQRLGRNEEAIPHYEWILAELEKAPLWPAPARFLDANAHYRLFTALRRSRGPRDPAAIQAGKVVLSEYPNTPYAVVIRDIALEEGWTDAR